MATNLRAPVTEDIWHLSIDDLLSPLPEKPRLGGPGPFVINLSSSTAGIGLPSLTFAGCEAAHAYEIQRNEDGRTRYRLRLGPFETEEAAELILDMVREIYPSALTATAGADDLKTIAMIRAKAAAAAEARRPHAPPKTPEPPPKPAVAAAKPAAAPASVPLAPPVAAPPVAKKAAVVVPAAAAAAAVSQPPGFNFDISIADIVSPKQPAPPIRSAVSNFVEPPLITERVDVTMAKRPFTAPSAKATNPPVVTQRVEAVATKPARAAVKPAAAVSTPSATPAPVAVATPVRVAAHAPTPVASTASMWASLPVASRSTIHKPQMAAAKPSMSVSAPLVRRPAVPAAAAKPVAPPKPAAAPIAPAMSASKAAAAPPHTKPAMAAPVKTPVEQQRPVPKPARTEPHVSLDSTQTMRALTSIELEDENALPWFVIELATAKEAFDPDTVPNLDIFAEYRLYSVAAAGQNDIVHTLRVGFFSAEIAAKAVASYLGEYYDKPAVKRVSLAERERFASQVVEARKDVGATGRHAVIEITDDLIARRKRVSVQNASPP